MKHYNDDLIPVHEIITSRLNTKKDKGLIILHGKPGTGKTSYIRHLVGTIDKPMLFIPPHLATQIASAGFLRTHVAVVKGFRHRFCRPALQGLCSQAEI